VQIPSRGAEVRASRGLASLTALRPLLVREKGVFMLPDHQLLR
jgi:hypothetical protein